MPQTQRCSVHLDKPATQVLRTTLQVTGFHPPHPRASRFLCDACAEAYGALPIEHTHQTLMALVSKALDLNPKG